MKRIAIVVFETNKFKDVKQEIHASVKKVPAKDHLLYRDFLDHKLKEINKENFEKWKISQLKTEKLFNFEEYLSELPERK